MSTGIMDGMRSGSSMRGGKSSLASSVPAMMYGTGRATSSAPSPPPPEPAAAATNAAMSPSCGSEGSGRFAPSATAGSSAELCEATIPGSSAGPPCCSAGREADWRSILRCFSCRRRLRVRVVAFICMCPTSVPMRSSMRLMSALGPWFTTALAICSRSATESRPFVVIPGESMLPPQSP